VLGRPADTPAAPADHRESARGAALRQRLRLDAMRVCTRLSIKATTGLTAKVTARHTRSSCPRRCWRRYESSPWHRPWLRIASWHRGRCSRTRIPPPAAVTPPGMCANPRSTHISPHWRRLACPCHHAGPRAI